MNAIRAILLNGVILILSTLLLSCGGKGGGGDTAIQRPAAPGGVAAVAGDQQVLLTWSAVNGAESYKIYWGTSAGVTTANASITNVQTPYVHTGLTNGQTCYYAIAAVNAAGESALSSEVSATPQSPSFVPSGLSMFAGNKQLTISWNPVSGAQSYNLYWSTSTGVTRTTGTRIAGVSPPYTHTGLTNGTTYYYVVTAVGPAGESVESDQISGAPMLTLPVPGAPTLQSGVQRNTIQWSTVPGASSYKLYWSKSATVSTANGTLIAGVTSPYTHTDLTAGTYYYILTAVHPEGESGPSPVASSPVNLISFLTSTAGTGNLKSWPYTGSALPGLDAGDTVCQVSANLAGLYGTFRAWLSDENSDAYCRVHNLSGKKTTNCGQASLPTSAGPWIRTDGTPFAGTINNMVYPGDHVYTPARYNENGVEVPNPTAYRTATDGYGILSAPTYTSTCSNWTSTILIGNGVLSGYSMNTGLFGGTTNACSENLPLLCFQTDTGPALPVRTTVGKKAFLSSRAGNGNFGSWTNAGGNTGLAAGDAICQSLATAASITGTFKAWLSNSTTNAIDRFTSNGPWVRLDGIKVADDKTDLTDGLFFSALKVTESRTYMSGFGAWTGTNDNGTRAVNNCNNWTDQTASFQGVAGNTTKAGLGWSSNWTSQGCHSTWIHLYCLED